MLSRDYKGLVQALRRCSQRAGAPELREDVARGRGILTALESGAKLPRGFEERQIVSANEPLGHFDNGAVERGLAVVVGRVLGDEACELGDLDLLDQPPLEARVDHLPDPHKHTHTHSLVTHESGSTTCTRA